MSTACNNYNGIGGCENSRGESPCDVGQTVLLPPTKSFLFEKDSKLTLTDESTSSTSTYLCNGLWEKKDCEFSQDSFANYKLFECVDKLEENESDRYHWCKQHMIERNWNKCQGWEDCENQGGTLHFAQWYPGSQCPDGVKGKQYPGGCGSYTYCSTD